MCRLHGLTTKVYRAKVGDHLVMKLAYTLSCSMPENNGPRHWQYRLHYLWPRPFGYPWRDQNIWCDQTIDYRMLFSKKMLIVLLPCMTQKLHWHTTWLNINLEHDNIIITIIYYGEPSRLQWVYTRLVSWSSKDVNRKIVMCKWEFHREFIKLAVCTYSRQNKFRQSVIPSSRSTSQHSNIASAGIIIYITTCTIL